MTDLARTTPWCLLTTQAAVAAAAVAAVVCATCVHVYTPNGPATKRVQATMLGSGKCTARALT